MEFAFVGYYDSCGLSPEEIAELSTLEIIGNPVRTFQEGNDEPVETFKYSAANNELIQQAWEIRARSIEIIHPFTYNFNTHNERHIIDFKRGLIHRRTRSWHRETDIYCTLIRRDGDKWSKLIDKMYVISFEDNITGIPHEICVEKNMVYTEFGIVVLRETNGPRMRDFHDPRQVIRIGRMNKSERINIGYDIKIIPFGNMYHQSLYGIEMFLKTEVVTIPTPEIQEIDGQVYCDTHKYVLIRKDDTDESDTDLIIRLKNMSNKQRKQMCSTAKLFVVEYNRPYVVIRNAIRFLDNFVNLCESQSSEQANENRNYAILSELLSPDNQERWFFNKDDELKARWNF